MPRRAMAGPYQGRRGVGLGRPGVTEYTNVDISARRKTGTSVIRNTVGWSEDDVRAFNGTTSSVIYGTGGLALDSTIVPNTSVVTAFAVIKRSSAAAFARIWEVTESPSVTQAVLGVDSGGNPYFQWGSRTFNGPGAGLIPLNTWMFVAVSHDTTASPVTGDARRP